MTYVTPDQVTSPQDRLDALEVIYDGGEGGWSLAKMKWDDDPAFGIRWNGTSNDPNTPSKGTPNSMGHPTWFILPEELGWMVAAATRALSTPDPNHKSII